MKPAPGAAITRLATPAAPAATPVPIDVFLRPGEYFVGDGRHRIRTLLGSCVSITLWHSRLCVGAMSHFLLAARGGRAAATRPSPDARYGEEALGLMIRELAQLGAAAQECEAKIFGGGDMFPEHHHAATQPVGRKNGEAARLLLGERGIPVRSESLFGIGHRKIVFEVRTGHVWSRQIDPADIQQPQGKA